MLPGAHIGQVKQATRKHPATRERVEQIVREPGRSADYCAQSLPLMLIERQPRML